MATVDCQSHTSNVVEMIVGQVPAQIQTEYLLKMELIALDERLCRTLNRMMRLCEQAEESHNEQDVAKIRKINRVLVMTKRRLERFS